MTKRQDALRSHYIIDGHEMDATPEQIISALCDQVPSAPEEQEAQEDIIDESADPLPGNDSFDKADVTKYASLTTNAVRNGFPLSYSGSLSRLAVAKALLEAIFRNGRFKLGNLKADVSWVWDEAPVGSMAAFYESVSLACEYLDNLCVGLRSYKYSSGAVSRLDINCNSVGHGGPGEALFGEDPFNSQAPRISPGQKCPSTVMAGKGNWLIYIPFDTCPYRLGGSLLSQVTGKDGGKSPDVEDADYFIDCFEVVRELVEDGIAVSGIPVADGGLMTALSKYLAGKAFKADIASLMHSGSETDPVKLLFGEVPGVIIEIRDFDFDYIDAELLLQDVAYFPLGQISGENGDLEIDTAGESALKGILVSLMDSASEGED